MKEQIQNSFFIYFEKLGYIKKQASKLVSNKPDILFTNSGMVQFANNFSVENTQINEKFITAQPCCRISGKHDDLNNIGYSPNHLTTFTMLGHFEFTNADIYKTMSYTLGFLKKIGINNENLYITVHPNIPDIDSVLLLAKQHNLEVVYLEDNKWSAGKDMPWGRTVEIFYKDKLHDLEIWNFVMVMGVGDIQYKNYKLDTGGGAERLRSIINGSFDVLSHAKNYISSAEIEINKIIEDHIQTIDLLSKEIEPSNKKQGYVLRMIMRRLITIEHLYDQKVYSSKHYDNESAVFNKALKTSYKMFEKELISRKSSLLKIMTYINQTYGAPVKLLISYMVKKIWSDET